MLEKHKDKSDIIKSIENVKNIIKSLPEKNFHENYS